MSSVRMPALFIGHGTPMNALEDNDYTRTWRELGRRLPRPKAILAVSALGDAWNGGDRHGRPAHRS